MENTKVEIAEKELNLKNNSLDIYVSGNSYINQIRLYHGYFNVVPNIKSIDYTDITAMRKWIKSELSNEILKEHYNQSYVYEKKKNFYSDHYFILNNGIVINLYSKNAYILFNPNLEIEAQELQNRLIRFKIRPKKTTKISMIISSNNKLITRDIEIKKPRLNIDLHYNDDFKKIHQIIVKNLKKPKTKGLYLFHGLPGTGKSTYIKYLIHQQTKQVIFLSPKIAGNLDDLSFTEFLLNNQNSILVIEDAEELILSRNGNHNTKLSFLLNLTDGLLGESLGIQIIATFNTDLKNIDKALLRRGRLTTIYDFKPLAIEKSNVLLKKLGHDIEVNNPLALADVFNFETDTNYKSKVSKVIGFKF